MITKKNRKIAYGNLLSARGYGCVYNPSLYCNNKEYLKNIDSNTNIPKYYKDKVSKFLHLDDAKIEKKQYAKLKNIQDFDDFYLGIPQMCTVGPYLTTYKSLSLKKNNNLKLKNLAINVKDLENTKKIKKSSHNNTNNNNNNYACDTRNLINPRMFESENLFKSTLSRRRLLLMTNGGKSLKDFDNIISINLSHTTINKQIVQLFIFEYFRMLFGIKNMINAKFIHRDLKDENILYNIDKNRLNFIDFGLSLSFKKYENNIINYWNFPPESFLLKTNFEKSIFNYVYLNNYIKRYPNFYKYNKNYLNHFMNFNKKNQSYMSNIYHLESFLPKNKILNKINNIYYPELLKLFKHILNNNKSQTQLDNLKTQIINKSKHTFDLYSYSTILLYLLNNSKVINSLLSKDEIYDLYIISYKCLTPNIFTRNSIDDTIEDFIVFFNKYDWINQNKNTEYFINNLKYFKNIDRSISQSELMSIRSDIERNNLPIEKIKSKSKSNITKKKKKVKIITPSHILNNINTIEKDKLHNRTLTPYNFYPIVIE